MFFCKEYYSLLFSIQHKNSYSHIRHAISNHFYLGQKNSREKAKLHQATIASLIQSTI